MRAIKTNSTVKFTTLLTVAFLLRIVSFIPVPLLVLLLLLLRELLIADLQGWYSTQDELIFDQQILLLAEGRCLCPHLIDEDEWFKG